MYSGENFRFRFNPLKDFVYCTQFLQAEAMKYAYNHWRREFRGPGQEVCSGILVWQLVRFPFSFSPLSLSLNAELLLIT